MRYTEFRDSIKKELTANPSGFTWKELRERLSLPYDQPCQTWVRQLENEIELIRKDRKHGAYIWKIISSRSK